MGFSPFQIHWRCLDSCPWRGSGSNTSGNRTPSPAAPWDCLAIIYYLSGDIQCPGRSWQRDLLVTQYLWDERQEQPARDYEEEEEEGREEGLTRG